jgi:hypothetical protein
MCRSTSVRSCSAASGAVAVVIALQLPRCRSYHGSILACQENFEFESAKLFQHMQKEID